MARNTEQKQAQIIIDGKKATATFTEMAKAANVLKTQLKSLPKNSDAFTKKQKEYHSMAAEVAKLDQEIKGVNKSLKSGGETSGKFAEGTAKTGKGVGKLKAVAGKLLPIFAAVFSIQKIIEFAAHLSRLTRKFSDLRNEIQHTFHTTGGETDKAAANIQGMSKALELETSAIQEAAKAIQNSFKGDINKHLKEMQKTLSSVSKTQREEILEQWKEYSVFAKENNMTFSQMNEILVKSSQAGIYSDKGMDTIKEFTLRMREMPKSTEDALTRIGINGKKLQQEITSGTKSYFDALREVSTAMGKLPEQSQRTGQALADIFGGAGEDAGIKFVKSLKNAGQGLDSVIDKSSKMYQQNQLRIAQEKELADVQNKISKQWEDSVRASDSLKKNLQILIYKGVLLLSTQWQKVMKTIREHLKPVRQMIANLAKQFGGWGTIANQVGDLIHQVFLRIMAPIRIVIGIIGKLAARINDIWESSGKFQSIIKGLATFIKTAFSVLVQGATAALGVINDLSEILISIVTLDFSGLRDSLVNAVSNAWGRIKNIGSTIKHGIQDIFQTEASVARKRAELQKKQAEEEKQRKKREWDDAIAELRKRAAIVEKQKKEETAKKKRQEELAKQQAEEARLKQIEAWKVQQAKIKQLQEQKAKEEADAAKRLVQLRLTAMKEGLPKQIHIINKEYDDKIAAIRGNEKQRLEEEKLLNKERELALIKLKKQFDDKKKEAEKQRAQDEAERRKRDFEIILTALVENENKEILELENQFSRRKISRKNFENQLYEIRKKAFEARINLLKVEHGESSKEYQLAYNQFLKFQKDYHDKELQKAGNQARKLQANRKKFWNGVLDITQEGIDFVLGIIEGQKDRKLSLLEAEAEELDAFYEGEKEKEMERYEEEQEILNERYEAEKEARDAKFAEENEALMLHLSEQKAIEEGRFDEQRFKAREAYDARKFRLNEKLQQLKNAGKGETDEARALEAALRKLDFEYKQQQLKADHEHKKKLSELDKNTKEQQKELEAKHQQENILSDDRFKNRLEQNEEIHKNTLIGMDSNHLAAKKSNEEEANRKSKKFTIAEILINLGREISSYFSHPASTLSLGVLGAAKAAFATVRAYSDISKINSQTFEQGGFLDVKNTRSLSKAALALANGGTLGEKVDAQGISQGFVVYGASHSEGGIELLDMKTGRLTGHQIEGNELIVPKNYVNTNPQTTQAITSGINLDALLFSQPNNNLVAATNPSPQKFESGGFLDGRQNASGFFPEPTNQETTADPLILEIFERVTGALEGLKTTQDRLNEELSDLGISYNKLDKMLIDRDELNREDQL